MPTGKNYQEIKTAFTQLLTLGSIVEDKEEMEFLIDAFAKHVLCTQPKKSSKKNCKILKL